MATSFSEVNALHAQALKVFPKPVYSGRKDFKKEKSDVIYHHCKKKGHPISQCFRLYGYPDRWKKDKGEAKSANNVFQDDQSSILGKASGSTDMLDSSGVDPVIASAVHNQVIRMMKTGGVSGSGASGRVAVDT